MGPELFCPCRVLSWLAKSSLLHSLSEQCQQNKDWRRRNMASAHAKELSGTLRPLNPSPIIPKAHFPWLPSAECVQLTSWITVCYTWRSFHSNTFLLDHLIFILEGIKVGLKGAWQKHWKGIKGHGCPLHHYPQLPVDDFMGHWGSMPFTLLHTFEKVPTRAAPSWRSPLITSWIPELKTS